MSMRLSKLGVHIKCKDFAKSLDFYLAFGFKPIFLYGSEEFRKRFDKVSSAPEKYNGITFEIGNALFEIAEAHVAVKPEVFREYIKSSKISAMIDVNDLSEVRRICEENAYEIAKDEVHYPWGTTELVVKDPDGFILVFRVVNY